MLDDTTMNCDKLVKRKKFIKEVSKYSKEVIIQTLLNYSSFGVFEEAFDVFIRCLQFTENNAKKSQ